MFHQIDRPSHFHYYTIGVCLLACFTRMQCASGTPILANLTGMNMTPGPRPSVISETTPGDPFTKKSFGIDNYFAGGVTSQVLPMEGGGNPTVGLSLPGLPTILDSLNVTTMSTLGASELVGMIPNATHITTLPKIIDIVHESQVSNGHDDRPTPTSKLDLSVGLGLPVEFNSTEEDSKSSKIHARKGVGELVGLAITHNTTLPKIIDTVHEPQVSIANNDTLTKKLDLSVKLPVKFNSTEEDSKLSKIHARKGAENPKINARKGAEVTKIFGRKGAYLDDDEKDYLTVLSSTSIPHQNKSTSKIFASTADIVNSTQSSVPVASSSNNSSDIAQDSPNISPQSNHNRSVTSTLIEETSKSSMDTKLDPKGSIIASYPLLKKKPKPLKTVDTNSFADITVLKERTSSQHEYVVPIVVAILAVPMLIVLALFLYKKGSEFWERRHYRRMDFLIDGMYND